MQSNLTTNHPIYGSTLEIRRELLAQPKDPVLPWQPQVKSLNSAPSRENSQYLAPFSHFLLPVPFFFPVLSPSSFALFHILVFSIYLAVFSLL
jgi:hypothetical protein